jgi:epsilon-lactone hydrolase
MWASRRLRARRVGRTRFGSKGTAHWFLTSIFALGLLAAVGLSGVAQLKQPATGVDANGTVDIPAHKVPLSRFISVEARKNFMAHLAWPVGPLEDRRIAKMREDSDRLIFLPAIAKEKALYTVSISSQTIAAVYTDVVTPAEGASPENRNRVLINLHGGGFSLGARTAGLAESIPIAAVGKIKVISVDFRQGPENKYPAATEDVEHVYRELLRTYQPANIGIYGCSAGGMLTAMAVAWFERKSIPLPGAIGILCSPAAVDFGGDSTYIAPPLNGEPPPPIDVPALGMSYLNGVDPKDPLVSPAYHPEVLARFPPTLIITSTRAVEFSSAVYSHTQLVKAGVDADLHVWEGMWHGFIYDPDQPESKEAYDVIVKFFMRHLGGFSSSDEKVHTQ